MFEYVGKPTPLFLNDETFITNIYYTVIHLFNSETLNKFNCKHEGCMEIGLFPCNESGSTDSCCLLHSDYQSSYENESDFYNEFGSKYFLIDIIKTLNSDIYHDIIKDLLEKITFDEEETAFIEKYINTKEKNKISENNDIGGRTIYKIYLKLRESYYGNEIHTENHIEKNKQLDDLLQKLDNKKLAIIKNKLATTDGLKNIFTNLANNLTKYINKDLNISDELLSTSTEVIAEHTSQTQLGYYWKQNGILSPNILKNSYSETYYGPDSIHQGLRNIGTFALREQYFNWLYNTVENFNFSKRIDFKNLTNSRANMDTINEILNKWNEIYLHNNLRPEHNSFRYNSMRLYKGNIYTNPQRSGSCAWFSIYWSVFFYYIINYPDKLINYFKKISVTLYNDYILGSEKSFNNLNSNIDIVLMYSAHNLLVSKKIIKSNLLDKLYENRFYYIKNNYKLVENSFDKFKLTLTDNYSYKFIMSDKELFSTHRNNVEYELMSIREGNDLDLEKFKYPQVNVELDYTCDPATYAIIQSDVISLFILNSYYKDRGKLSTVTFKNLNIPIFYSDNRVSLRLTRTEIKALIIYKNCYINDICGECNIPNEPIFFNERNTFNNEFKEKFKKRFETIVNLNDKLYRIETIHLYFNIWVYLRKYSPSLGIGPYLLTPNISKNAPSSLGILSVVLTRFQDSIICTTPDSNSLLGSVFVI